MLEDVRLIVDEGRRNAATFQANSNSHRSLLERCRDFLSNHPV